MGKRVSGLALALLSPLSVAQNQVNMSPGVTEIGADIFELHMLIMWICVVIGVAVFAVMFYSIYAHRKSKGHQASQFHESTKVEVAWTVVPFLILIAMAVPATSTLLEVYDNDEAELDILIPAISGSGSTSTSMSLANPWRSSLTSQQLRKRFITPRKRAITICSR